MWNWQEKASVAMCVWEIVQLSIVSLCYQIVYRSWSHKQLGGKWYPSPPAISQTCLIRNKIQDKVSARSSLSNQVAVLYWRKEIIFWAHWFTWTQIYLVNIVSQLYLSHAVWLPLLHHTAILKQFPANFLHFSEILKQGFNSLFSSERGVRLRSTTLKAKYGFLWIIMSTFLCFTRC